MRSFPTPSIRQFQMVTHSRDIRHSSHTEMPEKYLPLASDIRTVSQSFIAVVTMYVWL
ncbi:hypothetical protein DPMN_178601 [Dreissena polymorpha]|uniref:Uncharacterized protein n=1 Tax=Dreissena polymorpha TaxID=45954 RepID=A0A9D4EDP7_DREPO|nr:hypothetical protein DPMN_178601 [Dreissena polymorpha]